MKLGFSLAPQMILDNPEDEQSVTLHAYFGKTKFLLKELKDQGITSIEVRKLSRLLSEEVSERIINIIWDAGLEVSIHGDLDGDIKGNQFGDIYPSVKELIRNSNIYQKEIVMAIHAYVANEGDAEKLSKKTVEMLKYWVSMVEDEKIPIQFAIELNRRKLKVDPGASIEGVIQMISKINSSHVGITWDMGHYYSNIVSETGSLPKNNFLDLLPPSVFLENTVHTHIHGLGVKGTHCPLTEPDSLPLEKYIDALKSCGYEGIYNLEFDFKRFPNDDNIIKHVFSSIERLRNCVS